MSQLFDEAVQFTDETTGELLVGGFIYVGLNGLDVKLNPKAIFADRELTVALANPQLTGSDGRPENKIWLSGKYSFLVESSANVQKYNELENGFDEQVGNTLLINALGVNDVVVNGSPTVTTLVDSQTYIFTAPADNTGAMTLKIDNTPVMPLKIRHDQAVSSGEVKKDQKIVVVANLTDSIFEVVNDLSGVTLNGVETLTNKTLTTPTLTSPVINTPTIDGVAASTIVILDTPEQLSVSTTSGSWISSSGFASTTLSVAGAKKAILRFTVIDTTVAASLVINAYVRKAGSGVAAGTLTQILNASNNDNTSQALTARDTVETVVNLDGSSDFEYFLNSDVNPVTQGIIVLVGYYV